MNQWVRQQAQEIKKQYKGALLAFVVAGSMAWTKDLIDRATVIVALPERTEAKLNHMASRVNYIAAKVREIDQRQSMTDAYIRAGNDSAMRTRAVFNLQLHGHADDIAEIKRDLAQIREHLIRSHVMAAPIDNTRHVAHINYGTSKLAH